MNDVEAPQRQVAVSLMSPSCECIEHAGVALDDGGSGQVDVLCRPRVPTMAAVTFAIEVKAHERVGDRELGPWIKQAADYVGAIPANGWPHIVAAFIWLVGKTLHPSTDERLRMNGMLQLAQHFRVGHAFTDNRGLCLVFGPSAAVLARGSWTPRALELLTAQRTRAGHRAPLRK